MLILKDAKACFSEAKGILKTRNTEAEFYHRLAKMLPNTVDVDTLIFAVKLALDDSEVNQENTLPYISLIPKYVEQCATPEFSHAFRQKFIEEVLGLDVEEPEEVDYGYKEVSEGIIDISNKDRGEVLAALYNASIPIGPGFEHYNPIPWTKDVADYYLEQYAIRNDDSDVIVIDYILGRPIKCTFQGNLIAVSGYDNVNEKNQAERIISRCKNIPPKEIKK